MPNLLEQPSQYSRNSLERKQCTTVRRITLRRAGYEGEALADVAKARRIARRGIERAAENAAEFAIWSRELDRWIERERILLRIPLPAAVKAPEPRRVTGSTVNYTELPVSEPAIVQEQVQEPAQAQSEAKPQS